MTKILLRLIGDRKGATAVEYGLIISLIVIAMTTALNGVANATNNKWDYVANAVLAN